MDLWIKKAIKTVDCINTWSSNTSGDTPDSYQSQQYEGQNTL